MTTATAVTNQDNNHAVTTNNGVIDHESSETCAGASHKLKANGTLVFTKNNDSLAGDLDQGLVSRANGSSSYIHHNLRH